ncbi:MAG: hypothetical protein HYY96_16245 [Candidatus Tectomicrobia bacterium]|nr:hypothetical protein [Candidatus Tectomicrobia bacterium]
MVPVLIVAHENLAEAFLQTCRAILQDTASISCISVHANDDVDEARKTIRHKIHQLDKGRGVLILTDLFGGTPSNLSLSFLDELNVEVVTGLNLPMLIKLPFLDENADLRSIATTIMEYGRRNINVASQVLAGGSGGSPKQK